MFSDPLIFVVVGVNSFLGISIFLKDSRGKVNQWYAFFVLFLTLFITSAFLENRPDIVGIENVDFFLRLDFTSGILFSYAWLRFCQFFTKNQFADKGHRWLRILWTVFAGGIALLCLRSELVISNIVFYDGTSHFQIAPLWWLYSTFVIISLAAGVLLLFRARRSALIRQDTVYAQQVNFILFGFLLSIGNALFIFLFLQTFFPISLFTAQLGLYGMGFLTLFTAYAITRYKLFQIKVVTTHLLIIIALVFSFTHLFLDVTNTGNLLNNAAFFAGLVLFSIFLINSVNKEIAEREKAEHLIEQLRDFISFATHELRGPVANFRGTLSMMLEGDFGTISGDLKEGLRDMFIEADTMGQTVDMFLNLNKVEAERFSPNFVKEDIVKIISTILENMSYLLQKKNITLTYSAPDHPVTCEFDSLQIQHVLRNIIDNAIKYTDIGGTVEIKLHETHESVTIEVRDSGIGMSKETQEHIFTKYERGRKTEGFRARIEGYGIGMWLAKKIVEDLHHGQITGESKGEGSGSTFSFTLPRSQTSSKKEKLKDKEKITPEEPESALNSIQKEYKKMLK